MEDRQIGRAILDVTQKLTDAVNTIVGWQLETTTWLKRTLVVRQDATGGQKTIDSSPILDSRCTISGISGNSMDSNSIRGSTISLVAPNNRYFWIKIK